MMNEREYERGTRQAWVTMLRTCLRELGHDAPEANAARWVVEREELAAQLRSVCADFGDNDWPNDLHLGDVVEKHLGRHLHATAEKAAT